MNALLIGCEPGVSLGYSYTAAPPYDAVVIGSLTLGQLLHFDNEQVLEALSRGEQVILYEPGLPVSPGNRALAAALAARRRELKSWGVVFTDGGQKKLITAGEARHLRETGRKPGPGAVLTPLAREILEGKQ